MTSRLCDPRTKKTKIANHGLRAHNLVGQGSPAAYNEPLVTVTLGYELHGL
jgi:hypothetical protein